jgi:uncharacterized protein (TIGR02996 family)
MLVTSRSDELLADIVANPDDDAPRRVYADALLERGDPYGEFINVQLDLAGDGLSRTERIRRRRREAELLALHHDAWKATFDLAAHVRFRRGFVDVMTLDPDTLARRSSEVIARAPLLRMVNVEISGGDRDGALAQWTEALGSPVLPRLHGLVIGAYHLPRDGEDPNEEAIPEAIAMLAEAAEHWPLVALSMSGVTGTALDQFAASALVRRLRWIDLDLQRDAEAVRILDAIPRGELRGIRYRKFNTRLLSEPLRFLAVDGARREDVRAIASAPGLVQLRELALGSMQWEAISDLASARRLDALRVLRCHGRFTQFEVAEMLEWPLVKRLEVLDLRGVVDAARHGAELARRYDGILLVGATPTTAVLGECW